MRKCKDCGVEKPLDEFPKTWNGYHSRACAPCCKQRRSDQNLKLTFGMSREEFNERLEQQGNACAICGTAQPEGRYQTFNVDHCHETGNVRGILCRKCNMALGGFNDDISLLEQAILYLKTN